MDSSRGQLHSIADFLVKFPDIKQKPSEVKIRSARDEIVDMFVRGINAERKGTKYKPVTHKQIAIMLNSNPILGNNISECWYLHKRCQEKGFKVFWWIMKKS